MLLRLRNLIGEVWIPDKTGCIISNLCMSLFSQHWTLLSGATIHHWPGYEEESHGLLENNEEVSEDSENEDPDDPWRIQPEQQGWYLTLFLRLQPDVHGYIEG